MKLKGIRRLADIVGQTPGKNEIWMRYDGFWYGIQEFQIVEVEYTVGKLFVRLVGTTGISIIRNKNDIVVIYDNTPDAIWAIEFSCPGLYAHSNIVGGVIRQENRTIEELHAIVEGMVMRQFNQKYKQADFNFRWFGDAVGTLDVTGNQFKYTIDLVDLEVE
jgi:hypothetical protein